MTADVHNAVLRPQVFSLEMHNLNQFCVQFASRVACCVGACREAEYAAMGACTMQHCLHIIQVSMLLAVQS